jgi:Putative beta-lactamase-inhibitor-like, PepSY-like
MKSFIIILTVIFFSISYAQNLDNKDVPIIVKEKFISSFTKTVHVKWTKEKSNYEASFKTGDKQMSVNFDEKGNIIETETGIKLSELPIEVRESVAKDYSKYKITETAKIETKGLISYEVEVKRGKGKMDLIYDEHGVLKSKIKT